MTILPPPDRTRTTSPLSVLLSEENGREDLGGGKEGGGKGGVTRDRSIGNERGYKGRERDILGKGDFECWWRGQIVGD